MTFFTEEKTMCGIIGIYSHTPVAAEILDSLIHLQHRGQDAAGILTCSERFYVKHGIGLVREVFKADDIAHLRGKMGIGHTRYPTAGGYELADVQPLWIGSPRGIAIAHNGNLVNYKELAQEITHIKHRHLNSSIDSEVLLHLLADGLDQGPHIDDEGEGFFADLCASVKNIFNRVEGSFSAVSVIIGKGLVAFRDPHGIRPLVMGERVNADGSKDYIFASENTMFYPLGFEPKGDVQPGEIVFVTKAGKVFRSIVEKKEFAPCIFEDVYFARPDAKINEVGVYRSRLHMGQNLAKLWRKTYPDLLPDVVIPVPFTANTAALSFAHELGVRYSEGLYKNPFIGRTFIMPDGKERSRSVRYKLTPQKSEIEGNRVLMVDDSIVRGTTSREIVKMVREFGAKEIYFVSACPPIKNPCFYGIDMPSRSELIAANSSMEEIRNYMGVDKILYQEIADLVESVNRRLEKPIANPCMACMDGRYVTGGITEDTIQKLEKQRVCERVAGKGIS
jgi:amidophosphoribosyltransferase